MKHISPFTDDLTIHAGDVHRTIAPGAVVDLEHQLTPELTLRQALGAYAAAFVPADEPQPPAASKARRDTTITNPRTAAADVSQEKE